MTKPTNPPHPGSVLVERYLRPHGMSPITLASWIRVPRTRIERIVSGEVGVTADTALRLAKFFSTTPEYWMHLQCDWDLAGALEETDVSGIVPLKEMRDPKLPQPPAQRRSRKSASGAIIFGFDSAWANNHKGAICAIGIGRDGQSSFHEPELVYFADALEYIKERQQGYAYSLVAIDQPTIVRNKTGSRPVDRVAGSLISYVGGGAQPANLSKAALFGEHSPFRQFLSKLGATEDPLAARAAEAGDYMIEVYPALALPSLNSQFAERLGGPKYNPGNKRKFRQQDWVAVADVVADLAGRNSIDGLEAWAKCMASNGKPEKEDQDLLDAAICALVGYLWRFGSSGEVAMIGDLDSGYMITPISEDTRPRLGLARAREKVDVSDIVPLDEMGDPKPPQPPVPKPANGAIVFGFDSAWANNQEGAICAIGITQDGQSSFHEPKPVYFDDALEYIRERQQEYACSLVAIDQPTIVRNETGSRPVDRVAGSLIGYVGGGTQPANLSKAALFGENSPFRQFLLELGATEDPLAARAAEAGDYMIEVYPALALPSLNSPFAERLGGPKYNPEKENFRHEDWVAVIGVVACLARQYKIEGLETWANGMGKIKKHKTKKSAKAAQDCLDAAICALVGHLWRSGPSGEVAMIGDLDTGYMITPISGDTRPRLEKAAQKRGVPFCVPD